MTKVLFSLNIDLEPFPMDSIQFLVYVNPDVN